MSSARREILRNLALAALVAGSGLALAQAPPVGEQAEPCDPATAPCEEQAAVPEDDEAPLAPPSSEAAEAGIEAVVEEDAAIQASADEEFTPDDEISEDYPIPLPSDI
jgi:hypothetical protein